MLRVSLHSLWTLISLCWSEITSHFEQHLCSKILTYLFVMLVWIITSLLSHICVGSVSIIQIFMLYTGSFWLVPTAQHNTRHLLNLFRFMLINRSFHKYFSNPSTSACVRCWQVFLKRADPVVSFCDPVGVCGDHGAGEGGHVKQQGGVLRWHAGLCGCRQRSVQPLLWQRVWDQWAFPYEDFSGPHIRYSLHLGPECFLSTLLSF